MLTNLLTDDELVTLFNRGNETAFSEIYERYWSVLFLHARNLLRENEEAADIVQELFAAFYSKGGTIIINQSLSAYFYKAVRNKVLDHLKHKKVMDLYLKSINHFIANGELVKEDLLREKELAEIIENAITALPPKMREIFILSRKQHLSHQQIALQLNISSHTVKSQISNALKILRVKLGPMICLIFF